MLERLGVGVLVLGAAIYHLHVPVSSINLSVAFSVNCYFIEQLCQAGRVLVVVVTVVVVLAFA